MPEYRINRRIRVKEVRLVDAEGVNHGVVPINQAIDMAREAELDLVEVAPNAKPPVCRILDYGKFTYEQTKKEREARKRQKKVEIKTVRLSPRTDDFHRDIGVRNARRWLYEGKKVRFMVRFKAREISYPEIGQRSLQEIAEELNDVAIVEQKPTLEGWRMNLVLAPNPDAPRQEPKASENDDDFDDIDDIEEIDDIDEFDDDDDDDFDDDDDLDDDDNFDDDDDSDDDDDDSDDDDDLENDADDFDDDAENIEDDEVKEAEA